MDTTLALLSLAALALGAFVGAKSLWISPVGQRQARCVASALLALTAGAASYGVHSLTSASPAAGVLCLPAGSFGSRDGALGVALGLAAVVMAGRVFERRPASTPAALVALAAASVMAPATGAAVAAGIVAASFLRPLDGAPRPDLFRFALVAILAAGLGVYFESSGAGFGSLELRAAPGALALALAPAAVLVSVGFTRHFPRARDAERRGGEGEGSLTLPAPSAESRRLVSLYALTAIAAAGAALFFHSDAASLAAVCLGVLLGGALFDLAQRGGGRRTFAGLAGLLVLGFGALGLLRALS